MRLRTRIFRRLVIVALVPTIIIAAAACYFLSEAIAQASNWLMVSAPDRTINSLRLSETRLQDIAHDYLSRNEIERLSDIDSLFDWGIIMQSDSVVASFHTIELPPEVDSVFLNADYNPGIIRMVIGNYLVIGASVSQHSRRISCGFIFDYEYISGFRAVTASLTESRRFQNLMPGFILFLMASGATILILIIAGAYLISRRFAASVTTPLEQLTAATAGLAHGDKPQSISVSGTEEISRLVETFNRMIDDLEDSRKRLVAAERVAAWQGFARRMAHELKNPLTPISLSLYRIRKSLEKSGHYDKFSESIEAISAEVKRLERLATDYGTLAKLPEPKIVEFDFARLAREIVQLHAAQLENYNFVNRGVSETINTEGDPDHIHQVMVNLLKNAMEFTQSGKRIEITIHRDERMIVFEIANEGVDIKASDLEAAKMPYFSTRKGGSGLGLAISEKIIIDHGGSLSLRRENEMTIARFEIPRRNPRGVIH